MDACAVRVFEVVRGTTHDGPGIRTTFFLEGCPLRCAWCQNPEGIHPYPRVWWEARKCIGCDACVQACTAAALRASEAGIRRDETVCRGCGACVEACPASAMTFISRPWSLDELVKEALKDRDYHRAFGGGITVSGGEPLSQHAGVAQFFARLHEAGVHTALDTCGLAPAGALAAVLPHTDLVLFDIKLLDPELHRRFTEYTNEPILANLLAVAAHIRDAAPAMMLWIRTPLIPGATATTENIGSIAQFLRERVGEVVDRWELCAFNGVCRAKYEKLGLAWPYADQPLMRRSEVDALRATALASGLAPERVAVSGLVAP